MDTQHHQIVNPVDADHDFSADSSSLPVSAVSPKPAVDSLSCTTMTMRMALADFSSKADVDPKRLKLVVRDVTRAFKLEPMLADLPANGRSIRYVLQKFSRTKTLQNMRSNVRAVLKSANGVSSRGRTSIVLGIEWESLLGQEDVIRHRRHSLLRFARYCQQRNIKPADVTDKIFAKFSDWIEELETRKNPRKLMLAIVAVWNEIFVREQPSLHRLSVPALNILPQLTPSIDDLPDAVAAEIGKIMEFMSSDPCQKKRKRFDRREASEGGPQNERKKLSESTCLSYGKYIRRAVRILGEDPDREGAVVNLQEIIEPANMEFIMNCMSDELEAREKGERSLSLMGCAILFLARHYYAASEADLIQIKRMYNQVSRPEPKMTVKNLQRLRSLVLRKRHELMRLPAKLLNSAIKAIKEGRRTPRLLVDAQVAVAIAMLLSIPIREKNLAGIRVGEHLTIPAHRGTAGRLTIPKELVKNGVEIDRLVPVDVAQVLREYQKHVLPLLRSNAQSNALFPGRKDNSTRGPACLGTKVSERIKAHLGIEMNLHLFRHFVALIHLEEHPGDYEVVRILLGNRNLEIVKAFYAGAEHDAAIAKANAVVSQVKLDAGLNPKNMLEVTDKLKIRRGKGCDR